ncbi:MAG: hypothetical protein WCN27_04300 [Alphaproteobacteria bacterium]
MKNLIIMVALTTAFSASTFATHSELLLETTKPKRCGFAGLVDINVNINLNSGLCHSELSKHLGRLVDIKLNFNNVDIGEICGHTQKPKPVTKANAGKVASFAEGEPNPNGENDAGGKGDVIEFPEATGVTPYGIFKENYEGSKQNIFDALEKSTGNSLNSYDFSTSIVLGEKFEGNGILVKNTVARKDTDEKYAEKLGFLEKLTAGFFSVWQQDGETEPQTDISSKNIDSVLQHIVGTLGTTFFSIVEQHPVAQQQSAEKLASALLVQSVVKKEASAPKAAVQKKTPKKNAPKKEVATVKPKVQFDLSDSELDDSGLEYLFGDSE